MRIIRWSEERLAGYTWNCPAWIQEALEANLAFAYCMLDEERGQVAAWAAAYTEERRLELLAGGEDPNLVSAHPLERLCVRLQQFCKERQIPVMETERLGLSGDVAAHTLAAAGFVKEEGSSLRRLTVMEEGRPGTGYEYKSLAELSQEERESLVELLEGKGASIPEYRGSIVPELTVAAFRGGRAEAYLFVSSYRGTLLVNQLTYSSEEAGRSLWQALQSRFFQYDNKGMPVYAEIPAYDERILGEAPEVPVEIYAWVDTEEDILSPEDTEVDLALRSNQAEDLDGLLISRLYPLSKLLKEEQIENHMALDAELHPKLLLIAQSLGGEDLMEIRVLADDVSVGQFRFLVTTEFEGYSAGQQTMAKVSKLNRELPEGTVYWDEAGKLLLRANVPEKSLLEASYWRRFYRNWTRACRLIRNFS